MLEPADIAVEERAEVIHAVFEHREAIDSAAEREALPFVGVEAACLDHFPVDHARAKDFEPAIGLGAADDALALHQRVADVDLDRRFGEREVARAHPQHDVVALEERLHEGLERPFQVAERDALVDHEALDLVEHRRVRRVGVRAVGAAGGDDADRRFLVQHRADLDRRRVRAEEREGGLLVGGASGLRVDPLLEIEGVVHRPRGVRLGDVERGEIMPVGLDLGPGGDCEAEVGEDLGEFVHDLADRVDRAGGRGVRGERHVERFAGEARVERAAFERGFALGDTVGDGFAEALDQRALDKALVRGHLAERLQQRGDRALLAERLDPARIERV